ncbi:MAG: hypothetical protein ACYCZF_04240, partial [Anaerolineae bacterium]
MGQRNFMVTLATLLFLAALSGCDQATSTPTGKDGTPAPSLTSKSATTADKTGATKPSGDTTSAPSP